MGGEKPLLPGGDDPGGELEIEFEFELEFGLGILIGEALYIFW